MQAETEAKAQAHAISLNQSAREHEFKMQTLAADRAAKEQEAQIRIDNENARHSRDMRWFAPDHPAVYCDDLDAVALVTALGLDPAVSWPASPQPNAPS